MGGQVGKQVGRLVGKTWADVGGEGKKSSKKKPTWLGKGKIKVNMSSPPWLDQGQGGTKKVHPSLHHSSTLVHWWVLAHFGQRLHSSTKTIKHQLGKRGCFNCQREGMSSCSEKNEVFILGEKWWGNVFQKIEGEIMSKSSLSTLGTMSKRTCPYRIPL